MLFHVWGNKWQSFIKVEYLATLNVFKVYLKNVL